MASKFSIFTVFKAVDNMTNVTQKITSEVDRMSKSGVKATDALKASFSGIADIAKTAGIAVGAAGAAVFGLAVKASSAADDISNTASAIGMSTRSLQEYRYISVMAGMATEDMDTALNKLTINLGKSSDTTKNALVKLGLSVAKIKNTSPDKLLETIADGMKRVHSPSEKAAIMIELFGKSSIKMVNALSGGSEGIRAFREEAAKSGYVMDDLTIKAGSEFDDALDRLKLSFTGIANSIGIAVAPQLAGFVAQLTDGLKEGGKYRVMLDSIVGALSGLASVAMTVVSWLASMIVTLQPFAPLLLVLGVGITAFAIAINAVTWATELAAAAQLFWNTVIIANPIGLLIAGIAALIAAIIIFRKPIADFGKMIGKAIGGAIAFVKKCFTSLIGFIKQWGVYFLAAFFPVIGIPLLIIKHFDTIKSVFKGFLGFVGGIFDKIAGIASDVWNSIVQGIKNMFSGALKVILSGIAKVAEFFGLPTEGINKAIYSLENGGKQNTEAAPVSANSAILNGISTINSNTTQRSVLDINFKNPPSNATARSSGSKAPDINLNLGGLRATR